MNENLERKERKGEEGEIEYLVGLEVYLGLGPARGDHHVLPSSK